MSFNIGSIKIKNKVILAPMAGITDRPFRHICREFGAGLAFSEMVTSDIALYHSKKSFKRLDFKGEKAPIAVQILGNDPQKMAQAAKINADQGIDIIDINMGCPAKKVLKKAAGSALMQDEKLVAEILTAIVKAVDIPVTLKMRTGWDKSHKNAPDIAKIAEQAGISALTVHGRTRACKFAGEAEYQTIKQVVEAVNIPVIANGDIKTPEKAANVLKQTGAAAIMIGRGAQGTPWLFEQILTYLKTGQILNPPSQTQILKIMLAHCQQLYLFYGELKGLRIARKHIAWYSRHFQYNKVFKQQINQAENSQQQQQIIKALIS